MSVVRVIARRFDAKSCDLSNVCLDKNGDVYFSCGPEDIRVVRGSSVETFVEIAKYGIGSPSGVCFGKDGCLYFSDRRRNVIWKVVNGKARIYGGITPDGNYTTGVSCINDPSKIAFLSNGDLCVLHKEERSILIVNPDGSISKDPIQKNEKSSICTDLHGNLYIVGQKSGKIEKRTPDGRTVLLLDSGELYKPSAIIADLEGNLIVCEHYSGIIKRVSQTGIVTTVFCVNAIGKSQYFSYPLGLALDASGIYVTQLRSNDIVMKIELSTRWKPTLTSNFPIATRRRIKALMMMRRNRSLLSTLPREIMYIVLEYVTF